MTSRTGGPAPTEREALALNRLRALVAALTRSARTVERHTGVTNAQLFLLRQVATDEALSINDLAARAFTSQSTVSILVTRLQDAGYVRRARAADDGRRAMVSVTAAGRRLLERAPAPPTAQLAGALHDLSATELRALETGLAALLEHLGVDDTESPMLFNGGSASPRARHDG